MSFIAPKYEPKADATKFKDIVMPPDAPQIYVNQLTETSDGLFANTNQGLYRWCDAEYRFELCQFVDPEKE